jgi:hypothetical protein
VPEKDVDVAVTLREERKNERKIMAIERLMQCATRG